MDLRDNRMYVVYGLIDPRSDLIHYVGRTKNLFSRLLGHAMNRSEVPATADWIANLDVEGLLPIVRIFGNVCGLYECGEVERHLIRKFYIEGHPLTNRQGLYGSRDGKLVKRIQAMLDAK